MTTIQKHPRFKQDVENFNAKISMIADESEKQAAQILLKELIFAVQKLDAMHSELAYTRTLSNVGKDLQENIRVARIKLDKKLKSCRVN
jgi:hypothetical protein